MAHVEHRSPDGTLTLVVSDEDGDISIGFEGFAWHTHGDLLAASYPFEAVSGLTPESASERFVEDVVNNRAVIVVLRSGGAVRDVWITDDPTGEGRHTQPDESLQFRYWDGSDAVAAG
jgi:hypothetical protein